MVVTIQGETMKIREKSEKEVSKKSKSILKSEKIANKILEQERQRALSERATRIKQYAESVSYTHLTLPTSDLV